MITISRAFPGDISIKPKYDKAEIRAITLTELKKNLWDDLKRLKEYFIIRDPNQSQILSKHICYTVIRSCRLPLEKELIEKILEV